MAGVQGTVEAGPLEGHFPRRVLIINVAFRSVVVFLLLGYQIVPLAVLFYLKEEISAVAAVDFRVRGVEDRHLDLSRIGGAIHHRHGDAFMGVDL